MRKGCLLGKNGHTCVLLPSVRSLRPHTTLFPVLFLFFTRIFYEEIHTCTLALTCSTATEKPTSLATLRGQEKGERKIKWCTYIYMRKRVIFASSFSLSFDPPISQHHLQCYKMLHIMRYLGQSHEKGDKEREKLSRTSRSVEQFSTSESLPSNIHSAKVKRRQL